MRRLVTSIFMSLDGYIAGPKGEMDWFTKNFNGEIGEELLSQRAQQDTVLLGETTYKFFADIWPEEPDTDPFAKHINQVKKIVFSKTLHFAPWGQYKAADIISGNTLEEINKLKREPGKDIVIIGSANLIQNLAGLDLIDEYQIMLEPIILGGGKPLFLNYKDPLDLQLSKSRVFTNGAVALYYQPIKNT